MKKHFGKKSLSLLLAALMVLTALPFAAVTATAAGGTLKQSGWGIVSSNATRFNSSEKTFTVCSDGTRDSLSVGFIDFDISKISGTVDATLNISGKNSGNSNYNGEAFLEIFSIDPKKRPNVSGANSSEFERIFGSSGWAAKSYTNARNAKNTLGVLDQPAIAVMKTKDMDNNQTKAYSFDISEAVNNAKRAGQDKLCLAFLNPRSYNGNPSWSDINVFYDGASITYTESGSKEIAKSGSTLLYVEDSSRGDANHLNICSDGRRENTTAAFLTFDIGQISASASSVLFSTSVWSAQNANKNVVADIFSIDPAKCVDTSGWQTTLPYNEAFGSETAPNITQAKNYFGATKSIAQIGITKDGISSTAKTVTYDITAAVKEAKAANRSVLCLMIINPQAYNGGASNGWSDLNIAPSATKLIYSESASANAYGNFTSGKYYVKFVCNIKQWWKNPINSAWIGFYYKTANGTGTTEEHVDMPVAYETFSTTGEKTFEYVLDGFPTRIDVDCGGISDTSNFECQAISLSVGSSAGNYTTLNNLTLDSIWKLYRQNQDKRKTVVSGVSNNQYPYAKTFDWKTSPADTFVPKTVGDVNTVSAAVVAKDQYGVVMGTEYTPSIEKLPAVGSLSTISSTGLSVSKLGAGDFTASVSEDAKVQDTDFFAGKLSVSVASANTSNLGKGSKAFKIENQKENISINPNSGTLSKESYQVYYGSALGAAINEKLNGVAFPPEGTRDGYSFKGIYTFSSGGRKIESTEKIYSDTTYYAQWDINKYTVTFLDANGETLSTQTVNHGASANAPVNPTKASDGEKHYTFDRWDVDFKNVTGDLTVTPLFTEAEHRFVRVEENDKAATCESDAVWAYKCEDCDFTKTETQPGTATGHSWEEELRIPADCENDGSVSYSCSNCSATKTKTLAATGHNYVETVVSEPGCVSSGLKKYLCSNCKKYEQKDGKDKETVIDPIGHDWEEWTVDTAATCDKNGLKKRHCKRAGCQYVKEFDTEVINASGHTWSEEIFTESSTCKKQGRTYKKCLNDCEATLTVETLELAAHTPGDWKTLTEANCYHDGLKVRLCTACEEELERETVKTLPHDFVNYEKISDATCTEPAKEKGFCSRCKLSDTKNIEGSSALGHEFLDENYSYNGDATCFADGTKTAQCTRCEEKSTVAALGTKLSHVFTRYTSDNNATCTEDGTKTARCDYNCGETDTVVDVGSRKGHTVLSYTSNGDETCTADGTKSGVCSVCGNTVTVKNFGSKKAHSFTSYTHNTDATCLAEATEIAFCDYGCGTTDVKKVGSKSEHSYPDPETEADKYFSNNDATCKEKGTMSAYCTVCHLAKKTVTDPNSELKHFVANWISDNNATCTADGTKHGVCAYGCGTKFEDVPDVGSALGHWFRDYKFNEGSATCTADGTRTATCERDGCDVTDTVKAEGTALGHDWGEWKLLGEDADCENGGTRERACKRCDETEEKEFGALGHSYEWVVEKDDSDADCEKGYDKVKKCTVCDKTDESSRVHIAGSAHNFVVSEYVAPTCTESGKRVVSCAVCGKLYSDEELPKTGHLNYSLDEDTVVKATCNSEGYSGDYKCDDCGEIVKSGEATAKTAEHVFDTYVIVEKADCLNNAVEKSICSVCGEAETSREVAGSALGHTFSNYVSDGNATCTGISTKTSKCDRCDVTDTVKEYGTALGHDWSDWKTTVEPTCTAKGEAERHCKREGCGEKVTKPLRQLSHTESEWIVDKEPTCTEKGHRYKNCVGGCGYIFTEEVLPMLDHDFEVTECTATCISDGYSTYKCKNCGYEMKGEVVEALGHDEVIDPAVPATCTKNGLTEGSHCSRCGKVLKEQTATAKAHYDGDNDGKCDECGKEIEHSTDLNCGCICHKTSWLMRLIYKILRVLWKLFGLKSSCVCGARHY